MCCCRRPARNCPRASAVLAAIFGSDAIDCEPNCCDFCSMPSRNRNLRQNLRTLAPAGKIFPLFCVRLTAPAVNIHMEEKKRTARRVPLSVRPAVRGEGMAHIIPLWRATLRRGRTLGRSAARWVPLPARPAVRGEGMAHIIPLWRATLRRGRTLGRSAARPVPLLARPAVRRWGQTFTRPADVPRAPAPGKFLVCRAKLLTRLYRLVNILGG